MHYNKIINIKNFIRIINNLILTHLINLRKFIILFNDDSHLCILSNLIYLIVKKQR